eukprot:2332965-Rhodomonas_salina.2
MTSEDERARAVSSVGVCVGTCAGERRGGKSERKRRQERERARARARESDELGGEDLCGVGGDVVADGLGLHAVRHKHLPPPTHTHTPTQTRRREEEEDKTETEFRDRQNALPLSLSLSTVQPLACSVLAALDARRSARGEGRAHAHLEVDRALVAHLHHRVLLLRHLPPHLSPPNRKKKENPSRLPSDATVNTCPSQPLPPLPRSASEQLAAKESTKEQSRERREPTCSRTAYILGEVSLMILPSAIAVTKRCTGNSVFSPSGPAPAAAFAAGDPASASTSCGSPAFPSPGIARESFVRAPVRPSPTSFFTGAAGFASPGVSRNGSPISASSPSSSPM